MVSINLSNIIRIGGNSVYNTSGFENCVHLKNVILNPLMTEIAGKAFDNCTALEEIDLSHIKDIYDFAFHKATALKSIVNLNNAEIIGKNAFAMCKNLNIDLSLPSLRGTLDDGAFYSSGVVRILTLGQVENIGRTTTQYGNGSFRNCISLIQATLPSTVKSICYGAFWDCSALQWVKILAITPPSIQVRAFENTNNCPIYIPAASVDAYKLAPDWSNYASRIQPIID